MADPQSQDQRTPDAGSSASRPYRSKKQRPCDGCRRRRVGCFIASGQQDCTLCVHRGTSCTYELAAPVKKGRQPRKGQSSVSNSGEQWTAGALRSALGSTDNNVPPTPISPFLGRDDEIISSPDRTELFVGNSSDQDVYLLRHLPFDENNMFGRANWRVCKVLAHDITPAYFTSYPNYLLDAAPGIYDVDHVNKTVGGNQKHLLDLYYTYVHPNLPIMIPRTELDAALAAGSITASLLGALYCSARPFWHHSPSLIGKTPFEELVLREDVFQLFLQESKTPSLHTIRAILLYMQLPPKQVREPNHPGGWALTNQLVGLAQETGLHIDPANWNIPHREKHLRRVLWWAVYMHDKWLSHWLGRPSHIDEQQFSTAPLTMDDLIGISDHALDHRTFESMSGFLMLTKLTTVLSSVLDHFYTVARSSSVMPPEEALSRANQCQLQLKEVLEQQGSVLLHPSREINNYVFVFAYYGIAVSIQRALFACVGGTSYYDIERETILFRELFDIFRDLLQQHTLAGLWLSYCKSNTAIIGSFMVTALLASTDDEVYQIRQSALEEYRGLLQKSEMRFEFAALPLLRLNLLVERFTDNRTSREETPC